MYTIWLAFELAYIYVFAVETKGRSLEETAALFDGEETVSEIQQRTKVDLVESGHIDEKSLGESIVHEWVAEFEF